ncbi:hypothetical protein KQX54_015810 [Cotesia glomerata]|uniref:Secreted protein n=2 Tax=Cotesia glomerata TaxID=32391 RepID=A0AAV7ISN2_COTGL|nr:hypothetical protein KQX54_015810 [Cotesia glomerata]
MYKSELFIIVVLLPYVLPQNWQFVDTIRKLFISGRSEIDYIGIRYPMVRDGVRRQRSISKAVPFPCDTSIGR